MNELKNCLTLVHSLRNAPYVAKRLLNQILPLPCTVDNAHNLCDSVRCAIQDKVTANRKQAHVRSHIKTWRPHFLRGPQGRKCLVEAIKPMLRGDGIFSGYC